MRIATPLLLVALAALLPGCGKGVGVVTPAGGQALVVEVSTNQPGGSPGHDVTITMLAENRGTTTVYCLVNCYGPAMQVTMVGPDGKQVEFEDPRRIVPACVPYSRAFEPGYRIQNEIRFDGTLYRSDGEEYAAPPGIYTVIASLPYGGNEIGSVMEGGAKFYWIHP